jgi:hypothetical protein
MIKNDWKLATDEKRLVKLTQLQAMRKHAFRLIDHFTEVSGYAQIALAKVPAALVRPELEKIQCVAQTAVHGLRSCVAAVEEIERSPSD